MAVVPPQSAVVRFASFEVDLSTGELRKKGLQIRLQDQPFKILAMLLERPGELVTREQIKQKLWPADTFVDFEHSVNAAIRRLRDALGDDADAPRFIETLPRRGYRWMAELKVNGANSPQDEADRAALPAASPARAQSTWNWRLYAFAAVLVAAVGAVLLWQLRSPRPVESVAVLAFANETNDANLDYLASGIAESVLDNLAEIDTLRVTSRETSFGYRKKQKTSAEIAGELKVQALLTGVLRRNADKLEVSVELIDPRNERHIWGQRYSAGTERLADLEAEIAQEAARHLRHQVTPEVATRISMRRSANSQAYDWYLRGQFLSNTNINVNLQDAVRNFQNAIDADPNFALGFAGIARAYGGLAYNGGMDIKEALRLQELASNRALQLAPDLAYAHLTKADSLWAYHRDFDAAEREMKRALALAPNFAIAHYDYAVLLQSQARLDDALAETRRAKELDPMSARYQLYETTILCQARRLEEAIRVYEKQPLLTKSPVWNGLVYGAIGRKEAARSELKNVDFRKRPPRQMCWGAQAYAQIGDMEEGRRLLEEALRIQKEQGYTVPQFCSPAETAQTYASLGDRTKMFEWLRIADEQRDPQLLQWLRTNLPYDRYRSDPEFVAFVKQAYLPR